MSRLRRLPGDATTDSRATTFLVAIKAINEAVQSVERLQDGLFGFQLDEVVAAKVLVGRAAQRLIAVAQLRGPNSPAVRRAQRAENV